MAERTGISARLNSAPKKERSCIAPPGNSFLPAGTGFSSAVIHRKASCACGGGCPVCQAKSSDLNVSQPNDPAEIEADRAADAFAAVGTPGTSCVACGAHDGEIMRKAREASGAPTAAASELRSAAGSGRALPRQTMRPFENFFGVDLSRVRVHDNAAAARAAGALSAEAFAVGSDVAFAAGKYDPGSCAGRRLLAHELAHVVQQAGGAPSRRLSPRPPGYARQGTPHTNPVLTLDEMFQIVVRERAWTFSPGGGAVDVDPQGVGRGVGPAAGRKRAGHSVFAVIQVTDADGRPVALTYGEHISYGDPHAEERAVAGLRREIPAARDLFGGRMTVVVDQTPCPPGRADCIGRLQSFARERGLHLEVHLPTRQAMRGSAQVGPRTAAMSSQRTDVPPVSLTRYDPGGGGASTPGGAPRTPAPAAPASAAPRPAGTMRFAPPKPASADAVKARASLMASLKTQTQRSVRLNTRIKVMLTGVSGVMGVLDMISALQSGFKFAAHGTLFPEAEEMVDQVSAYGKEMVQWSNEVSDEISIVSALAAVDDAEARDDSDALFDIDAALTDLYLQLYEKADYLRGVSTDLRAREKGLAVLEDLYAKMKYAPSITTASNFEALAMEESLGRLSGQMGNAASHFEEAEGLLRYYADYFTKLSKEANDRAWSINWVRVAVAQREIDRERELGEKLGRERRLNEIHAEIESVEGQLNEPVSRLPEDEANLWQRRDALFRERAELLSGAPVP